jgi:hypothetical protein
MIKRRKYVSAKFGMSIGFWLALKRSFHLTAKALDFGLALALILSPLQTVVAASTPLPWRFDANGYFNPSCHPPGFRRGN